ncbi:putrescine transport system substrate-binding protein [Vogesella sp. LIG4]|nr:putrescine transport system substrate-binding protein [Vogesella sp. LIG4]
MRIDKYPTMALAAGLCLAACLAQAAGVLNIANWADYTGKDTVPRFTKETGIKVNLDPIDSEETLQTKLLLGKSSIDIAVPASSFLHNQLQAGLYQKLDKSRLSKLDKLDKELMKKLAVVDPGNQYGIPYGWGTTGLAINVTKVRQILGPNVPLDSWELLYNPQYVSRLKQCGVGLLESPVDVLGSMLKYQHKDTTRFSGSDVQEAFARLKEIRTYVTQVNSSSYTSDLAQGDLCLTMAWSGDAARAIQQAKQGKKPYEIKYVLPKEGAAIWFDVMAIPKDAPHLDAAYQWLNYIETPDVHAGISNETLYLSGNREANALVKPEIRNDPTISPTPAQILTLSPVAGITSEQQRLLNRLWTAFKAGR